MGRQQLETFFSEQQYYFHGSSSHGLIELEPRQAYSRGKPDGQPAVFAAYGIDPAIFMAILGKRAKAGWDSYSYPGPFGFYVMRSSYEQARAEDWGGSVYAIDRNEFDDHGVAIMKALGKVQVLHEVIVSLEDLDFDSITIVDDDNPIY